MSPPRGVVPDPAGPGQESVWDYPRPPALVRSTRRVRVALEGRLVAESRRAWRVLETSHPPTWYLPRADVPAGVLQPSSAPSTTCEWKGPATYWDVVAPGHPPLVAAAWSYERPHAPYADLTGAVAFRADRLACSVDGERVRPQAGGFYGGWITADVVGPFKGAPGSYGW
jgi:uncharacterized protein (DUF427 family)